MADEPIIASKEQISDSQARSLANLRPWRPGQSGNPAGRTVKKPFTEMFERIMNDPVLVAEFEKSIVRSITKGGMAGVMYFKEGADRIEGKISQPIEADITVNLSDAIAEARKRAGK